jgi:hypothetical protein
VEKMEKMEKLQSRDVRVHVRFTQEEYERIKKYASKTKVPMSSMLRNLALVGLDSADFMYKFGIFNLVSFLRENEVKPMDILQLADDIV